MLAKFFDQLIRQGIKSKLLKPLVKAVIVSPKLVPYNFDADFHKMQQSYPPYPEYGYDNLSTWQRAAKRVLYLLEKLEIHQPGLSILDAACGDGMLGVLMNSYGHYTTLVDATDWRDPRARGLPFRMQQLENLDQFASDQFDLVCSYNSFEHLADPQVAFEELLRVCKPKGGVFLEFGPLYYGPWGLHAYRTLRMPYPQFIFSEEFIASKLHELGISDLGKERTELQFLNRWKYSDFTALWKEHSGCRVVFQNRMLNEMHLDAIIKYPGAFRGRGFDYLELMTHGIRVFIEKC